MRLGTCLHHGQATPFFVADNTLVLPYATTGDSQITLLDLIRGGPSALDEFRDLGEQAEADTRLPLTSVQLLAPIPRPAKNIMCLGWNYSEHVQETSKLSGRSAKLPEHPIVFTKSPTSVIGHGAGIPYDTAVSTQLDWEVELAVIIGQKGKNIPPDRAGEHIFGYTIVNDVSARDLQFRHKQFFIGKSLDGACPMGPWIVTADEIRDPQNLDLRCKVNGITKQDSNTGNMIFDIATIIATLSKGMTLEPGDIIATGTPDGVGFARKPPEFLVPGDAVCCEIQDIGELSNQVVET